MVMVVVAFLEHALAKVSCMIKLGSVENGQVSCKNGLLVYLERKHILLFLLQFQRG